MKGSPLWVVVLAVVITFFIMGFLVISFEDTDSTYTSSTPEQPCYKMYLKCHNCGSATKYCIPEGQVVEEYKQEIQPKCSYCKIEQGITK